MEAVPRGATLQDIGVMLRTWPNVCLADHGDVFRKLMPNLCSLIIWGFANEGHGKGERCERKGPKARSGQVLRLPGDEVCALLRA